MNTLIGLMRSATEACNTRGHRMRRWTGDEANRTTDCRVCGMGVQVLLRPMPNEIDIGGKAVALDCEELPDLNPTDALVSQAVDAYVKAFHSDKAEDTDKAIALIAKLSPHNEARVYDLGRDRIRT